MALLESYGAANMVVHEDLSVRYAQTRKQMTFTVTSAGQTTTQAGWYWVVSRRARKDYSFVGMTEAAARACAEAKTAMYTRASYSADSPQNGGMLAKVECTANIVARRIDDDSNAWETRIQVDEYDERLSESMQSDPASFMGLGYRYYDEGDPAAYAAGAGKLTLISAKRLNNGIDSITYSHTIEAFDPASCIVQYLGRATEQNPVANWTGDTALSNGGITVTDHDLMDEPVQLRLVYGSGNSQVISNSITVPPSSAHATGVNIFITVPSEAGQGEGEGE